MNIFSKKAIKATKFVKKVKTLQIKKKAKKLQ